MARKKLRVGILFGGRSGEHEVSLRSARSILQAIDRKKYDVVELGITKEGRWLQSEAAQNLLAGGAPSAAKKSAGTGVALAAAEPGATYGPRCCLPGAARDLRRRWHDSGTVGTRRCGLCRLRSAGLGSRHGQGRHEAAVSRSGSADHASRIDAALRVARGCEACDEGD